MVKSKNTIRLEWNISGEGCPIKDQDWWIQSCKEQSMGHTKSIGISLLSNITYNKPLDLYFYYKYLIWFLIGHHKLNIIQFAFSCQGKLIIAYMTGKKQGRFMDQVGTSEVYIKFYF